MQERNVDKAELIKAIMELNDKQRLALLKWLEENIPQALKRIS